MNGWVGGRGGGREGGRREKGGMDEGVSEYRIFESIHKPCP